jgi:hypothetical protein
MARLAAARLFRLLALAVAAHGVVFAVAAAILARLDNGHLEAAGDVYFFLIVAPAMVLAVPFSPLLWRLHLMHAPGWFAWPTPLGLALVYAAWVLVLFALSLLVRGREAARV